MKVGVFVSRFSDKDSLELYDRFRNEIEPICRQYNFTFHECFQYLKQNDFSLYSVLSNLWHTEYGKAYLRSAFRGGRLPKY